MVAKWYKVYKYCVRGEGNRFFSEGVSKGVFQPQGLYPPLLQWCPFVWAYADAQDTNEVFTVWV